MTITGHRTVSVFLHYNIVSTQQLPDGMAKVSNNARTTQNVASASPKLLKSRGSSVVEQPIRNRQVAGSSPALGSRFFYNLQISSPRPAAHLLHKQFSALVASSLPSPRSAPS